MQVPRRVGGNVFEGEKDTRMRGREGKEKEEKTCE